MSKIAAIVAMDEGGVIGYKGKIPWDLPADLENFKRLTRGQTVLMGRKTFETLKAPLPDRLNLVGTHHPLTLASNNVRSCVDLFALLERVSNGVEPLQGDTLWVIGGAQIYAVTMPWWDELHITRVAGRHQGDVVMPDFEWRTDLTVQWYDFS